MVVTIVKITDYKDFDTNRPCRNNLVASEIRAGTLIFMMYTSSMEQRRSQSISRGDKRIVWNGKYIQNKSQRNGWCIFCRYQVIEKWKKILNIVGINYCTEQSGTDMVGTANILKRKDHWQCLSISYPCTHIIYMEDSQVMKQRILETSQVDETLHTQTTATIQRQSRDETRRSPSSKPCDSASKCSISGSL